MNFGPCDVCGSVGFYPSICRECLEPLCEECAAYWDWDTRIVARCWPCDVETVAEAVAARCWLCEVEDAGEAR